jgi:rod shape-determining protein MreD
MGNSRPRRLEEHIAHELLLALALLVVAMAQTSLLPRPLDFPPNLVLMLTICRALLTGLPNASRWAFYGGLGLDICANSVLGSHSLALLAAVLVAGLPLMRLSRDNWLLPIIGVLLGAIAYEVVFALVTALMGAAPPPNAYLTLVLLPSLVMALVPALPLFLAMRWIRSRRRGEVPIDVY